MIVVDSSVWIDYFNGKVNPCTEQAIFSAHCYRQLRKRGFTARKTADVIIASFCLSQGHALLSADQDFRPFAEHMGLELLR
ncbi:MAG: hypothetical protein Q4B17_02570 [Lautropia sp.]|nr:hypothetical protein [Lautropia sp.]